LRGGGDVGLRGYGLWLMNVKRDGCVGRRIWLRSSAEIGRTGGCGMLLRIDGELAMQWEALVDDDEVTRLWSDTPRVCLSRTSRMREKWHRERKVKSGRESRACLANRKARLITGLGTPAQPLMPMGIREMKLCMKPARRRSCAHDSFVPSHPA
jgi:hypothetical protein